MAVVINAALGMILAELVEVVVEAKKKAKEFKTILESMESTLLPVTRELVKIKLLEKVLDCGDDEELRMLKAKIERGKELVLKCAKKGKFWQKISPCLFSNHDLKELRKLDDSLKRFCQIVMPLIQTRIQMETLVEVKETHEDVKYIQEDIEDIQEKIEDGHRVVEDVHKEVRMIREEVKQVEEIGQDVKGISNDVENMGKKVSEIHEEVKKMPEMHDDLKATHADVKDIDKQLKQIHEGVTDLKMDMKNGKAAVSPLLNNTLRLCTAPEPPKVTVGLDKPLGDLRNELFKNGTSVTVLTAPGGCGKSTLAKLLCQDAAVKGKFQDNIFFVTVSKAPNMKVIVQQLFLHKGYTVHEFQTDEEAINSLEQLLKKLGPEPILLVLDDVWPKSESLVDKFKLQIPEFKILVTSRSDLPSFGSTYKLNTLNSKDSMSLFQHSAGLQDRTSLDEDTVNKIVNVCKGFPLAITVVGRSLRGKPEAIWKDRVKKWSKGVSFFEDNIDLRDCLQSSIDALDHKLKKCYMDLAVFPEGQLIPATAIIDMWEELYEFNGDGVTSIANLHVLSSLNLLNFVPTRKDAREAEGYYNDHFVTQHDLLRDLINHLSGLDGAEKKRKRLVVDINGNEFPHWWEQQKHETISARLLSISTEDTFQSKWSNLNAPEVEVLVLNFHSNSYTLPKFIKSMDKLKTLLVTNYGFLQAEVSNFTVLGNLSNLKRIRLEQVLIPSLTLNCELLEKVQKISMLRCNMGQAFSHNAIKIHDALPNLLEINLAYCDNLVELPSGLCDIVLLKKLCITNCHDLSALPQEIGKLVNLEVLMLSSCMNLLELPESIGSLHKLNMLDISDCVSIKKLPAQIGELQNLRKLYMKGCANCELPKSVTNLVKLKSVICDEETATLWKPFKRHLSNLAVNK